MIQGKRFSIVETLRVLGAVVGDSGGHVGRIIRDIICHAKEIAIYFLGTREILILKNLN